MEIGILKNVMKMAKKSNQSGSYWNLGQTGPRGQRGIGAIIRNIYILINIYHADIIPGGKSVEEIIFEDKKDSRLEVYINRLSRTQREIAELLANGYKPNEIQNALGLTSKQYFDNLTEMRNPENTNILKGWIR